MAMFLPIIIKETDVPTLQELLDDAQSSEKGVLTLDYVRTLGINVLAYDKLSVLVLRVRDEEGVKVKEVNLSTKLKSQMKDLEFRDRKEYDAE